MVYLEPPHLPRCGCNSCVDGQKRREMTDQLNAPRSCPQCARFKAKLNREKMAEMLRPDAWWMSGRMSVQGEKEALLEIADAIIKHLTE